MIGKSILRLGRWVQGHALNQLVHVLRVQAAAQQPTLGGCE
jgi:hypothetical protein